MNVKQYDATGVESGTFELSDELFAVEANDPVMHQAVVARLANERQGTAAAKGRSDVSGTNKKPFRQKKTGQARRGDMKTNIVTGGGVWGGPQPRSYRQKLPKKQRQLALRSALSIRAAEGAVAVIADLPVESGKTRDVASVLKAAGIEGRRTVVVTHNPTESFLRASRNLANVVTLPVSSLHPYEILWAENVLVTASAAEQLKSGGAE